MIVRHCQSESIRTWGELGESASTGVGSTPVDALVELRKQIPCTCASGCDCQHHHDPKHDVSHHKVRLPDTALEPK